MGPLCFFRWIDTQKDLENFQPKWAFSAIPNYQYLTEKDRFSALDVCHGGGERSSGLKFLEFD